MRKVARITRGALLELIEMSQNGGIGILTNQPANVAGRHAFGQLVRAGFAKSTKYEHEFKITKAGRLAVWRACLAAGSRKVPD
jgi:hypothetical protein